jgi:uncharacterized protein
MSLQDGLPLLVEDAAGQQPDEPSAPPHPASLARKLARLQGQAGARRSPPSTASARLTVPAAPPAALTVERLRALLARRPSGATPFVPPPAAADRTLPGSLLAPGLRYLERWLPCAAPPSFEPHWCDGGAVAAGQLLCFDTETTGLAGGSGTRAFMIGAADWRDGGLRLRQLYLETIAAEPAMLAEFARWLGPERVLVSYNGRCYDAPLLTTRYRLARQPCPLAGLRHLDLLTPVRRRFRRQWENCRLATAERELLGVLRHDDLPGSQAPAAWLDYLRGGSAARLRRVLAHNSQDLESLAGLLLALPGAVGE